MQLLIGPGQSNATCRHQLLFLIRFMKVITCHDDHLSHDALVFVVSCFVRIQSALLAPDSEKVLHLKLPVFTAHMEHVFAHEAHASFLAQQYSPLPFPLA